MRSKRVSANRSRARRSYFADKTGTQLAAAAGDDDARRAARGDAHARSAAADSAYRISRRRIVTRSRKKAACASRPRPGIELIGPAEPRCGCRKFIYRDRSARRARSRRYAFRHQSRRRRRRCARGARTRCRRRSHALQGAYLASQYRRSTRGELAGTGSPAAIDDIVALVMTRGRDGRARHGAPPLSYGRGARRNRAV